MSSQSPAQGVKPSPSPSSTTPSQSRSVPPQRSPGKTEGSSSSQSPSLSGTPSPSLSTEPSSAIATSSIPKPSSASSELKVTSSTNVLNQIPRNTPPGSGTSGVRSSKLSTSAPSRQPSTNSEPSTSTSRSEITC